MKEVERKFILGYMPAEIGNQVPLVMEQGYLLLADGKQLRVRIIDGKEGMLCYKTHVSDTTRNEYEFPIPIDVAKELMASTKIKIKKQRFKLTWRTYQVDIDVYDGSELRVVEIEGEGIEDIPTVMFPPYCSQEVTGNDDYSNIKLALNKSKNV